MDRQTLLKGTAFESNRRLVARIELRLTKVRLVLLLCQLLVFRLAYLQTVIVKVLAPLFGYFEVIVRNVNNLLLLIASLLICLCCVALVF